LIITLVFEKNAIFSQKIGKNRRKLWIITSTPDLGELWPFERKTFSKTNVQRVPFWSFLSRLRQCLNNSVGSISELNFWAIFGRFPKTFRSHCSALRTPTPLPCARACWFCPITCVACMAVFWQLRSCGPQPVVESRVQLRSVRNLPISLIFN
jgi:hypothetical protein